MLRGNYKGINLKKYITTLFMLEMMHTFATEIKEKINNGTTIILDRYWYSNIYYQGNRNNEYGISEEWKSQIDEMIDMAKDFKLPKPESLYLYD